MNVRKTDRMLLIEARRGKSIESILVELTEQGLTNKEIARELGVTEQCLAIWKHDLGARPVRSLRFEQRELAAA